MLHVTEVPRTGPPPLFFRELVARKAPLAHLGLFLRHHFLMLAPYLEGEQMSRHNSGIQRRLVISQLHLDQITSSSQLLRLCF